MMRTAILAAVAVAWFGSGVVSAAKPTAKYGSFVVSNPSKATISYEVKWGASEWKVFTLEPGERRCHYHVTSVHETVPTPRLRYDCDLATGMVALKEFEPETTGVNDPWHGMKYTFKIADGGRYVYLYYAD